jgi:hypothetical protein
MAPTTPTVGAKKIKIAPGNTIKNMSAHIGAASKAVQSETSSKARATPVTAAAPTAKVSIKKPKAITTNDKTAPAIPRTATKSVPKVSTAQKTSGEDEDDDFAELFPLEELAEPKAKDAEKLKRKETVPMEESVRRLRALGRDINFPVASQKIHSAPVTALPSPTKKAASHQLLAPDFEQRLSLQTMKDNAIWELEDCSKELRIAHKAWSASFLLTRTPQPRRRSRRP